MRKTPCKEGLQDLRLSPIAYPQERVIDLHSPTEIVKQISSISVAPGVEVEVTIANA
jgi:small subunit ribosomal protein S20e